MNNSIIQEDWDNEREEKMVEDAKNDPQAFACLYDIYISPVFHYLLSHVGDPLAAQDLTSQVFLSVLDHLYSYHHQGHFAAWLFTIARHKWTDYFRQDHRELSIETVRNLPTKEDPLLTALDQEEIQTIRGIVFQLPKPDQELIYLRFVARLSFIDMAIILGCKEEAAKKRLYRLLGRLEKEMEALNG